MEGIATLEDVLEEIVGEIFDESDLSRPEFHKMADGALIARARVDLRKLCGRLGIPWDPEIGASTAGGLVTEILERIPVGGDSVSWKGYRIEVLRADERARSCCASARFAVTDGAHRERCRAIVGDFSDTSLRPRYLR